MITSNGRVLVVDDNEVNRIVLSRRLLQQSLTVVLAENGRQALSEMRTQPFDLVLLDIMMPEIDGYQVLEEIKADRQLRHIPVIMISALDNLDSVVRCIELGAEDYLLKPFNPTLLKARIGACLEKKHLRDQEYAHLQQLQSYLRKLQEEQEKSERLLLNILPKPIADRLKQNSETIADNFAEVTVLFADIVNFTELSACLTPIELVRMLNKIFSTFDHLVGKHQLEKIKTIGDAYLVVGGLPIPRPDHAEAVAELALEMREAITDLDFPELTLQLPLTLRIGINTGPVGAGVIGITKFSYDLWGDTVNTAARMESLALPGQIQVTAETYELIKHRYQFQTRGMIDVKGKGRLTTYLITGRN